MLCLGFDPGLTGGMAALAANGQVVSLAPMPVLDGKVDPRALASWVRSLPRTPEDRLAVELVGAMPGQGVVSMFSFGETTGIILGVLGALGGFPARPRPQTWQGDLGIALPAVKRAKGVVATQAEKTARRAAVKAAALAYVVSRIGSEAITLPGCRKPHDGMVDAYCIADWLRVPSRPLDWLS